MADSVFRTRSLGTAAEGVKDQYADGKAAKVWEIFIGDKNSRTKNYKNFLVNLLKNKGCKRILDVACGTGIDSIMLLEEGFEVVSVDASDKMLKYALKSRWNRRREESFDKWIIEEANWLTLYDDIEDIVGNGFDAVICLGNSFAHLLDNYGDQREQKQALRNFEKCVKPGGLLLIDHRNYDDIIDTGRTASKCIYYNSKHTTDIKTSVLYTCGKAALVILDYLIDISSTEDKKDEQITTEDYISEFRLSYYPHRLKVFKDMLKDAFGENSSFKIFGDFKTLEEIETPNFYIHVVEKYNNNKRLYEFLIQLLNDSEQRFMHFIAWKDTFNGIFKIMDPEGLAKLWGIQKNHPKMNYDKLSRALRYYYKTNKMRKVPNARQCYQFIFPTVQDALLKNSYKKEEDYNY